MARPALRRPTDAELEILRVLWELGSATVRQVHETLARGADHRGRGTTTVLKHMQIMVEKGLLLRDDGQRPQVYRPSRSSEQTRGQLLRHLLDKAFAGSAGDLALAALATERATPEERQAVRELLDRLESGKRAARGGEDRS